MGGMDEIFDQRLERIREELDAYIGLRFSGEAVNTASLLNMDDAIEKKMPCQSPVTLQNPRIRKQTAGAPAKRRKIPDFLSGGEKHAQIDKVLDQREESFSTRLLRLIDEKGLKDSEVYKSANIDRRLFSKIRGDEDYMPSKKTAISFCLALQLEMDETKKLLETAGYTLSASSRFDLIIMYLIENSEYNIHFANIVLDDYGEGTLSR